MLQGCVGTFLEPLVGENCGKYVLLWEDSVPKSKLY